MTDTSPIIRSCYNGDGQYLCYVSVELDKQRVSVVPTSSYDSSVELPSLLIDESGLRVTQLCWFGAQDIQCVLIGLSNGEIWIYSPLANEIVTKLSTTNGHAITGMDVNSAYIWCCDANDMLYQFDAKSYQLLKHFKVDNVKALTQLTIFNDEQLLLASHSIYLVSLSDKKVLLTYPGHITPVSKLTKLNNQYFISSASSDRFLNIYDVQSGETKNILVSNSNIVNYRADKENDIIVTTESGSVEVFKDVLVSSDITSTKKRSRVKKSKQPDNIINLVSEQDQKKSFPVLDAFIKSRLLSLVWFSNVTVPRFVDLNLENIPRDYQHQVDSKLRQKNFNDSRSLYGTDVASTKAYKEGNATITSGDNYRHVTQAIQDWEKELQEKEKAGEDTSGDLSLQDKLEASNFSKLSNNFAKNKISTSSDKLTKSAIVAGTVTTVLAQALQSNDHSLLETVLNNRDERVIRDTILRLKAPLAIILLERLAERIARQSHRQGPLNIWVKWCLIIHGAYLVNIPNLMSSLASLHSTLRKRAELLPKLMGLEARLNNVVISPTSKEDLEDEVTVEFDEDEEDVEYNEDLDDAGLIDDGEEEYETGSEEEDDDSEVEGDDKQALEEDDDSEADEEGYSDVEV